MDINLFEELNYKKVNHSNLLIVFLLSLLLIGLLIIIINNQLTISKLNADIDNRLEIIKNPKSQEKITELKELAIELDNKKQEFDRLNSLDNTISELNVFTFQTLDDINSGTIDGVILSSINFNESTIELNGVGANPNKIAEYSDILDEFDSVKEIHISHISQSNEYYNFLINLTLKGESIEVTN